MTTEEYDFLLLKYDSLGYDEKISSSRLKTLTEYVNEDYEFRIP